MVRGLSIFIAAALAAAPAGAAAASVSALISYSESPGNTVLQTRIDDAAAASSLALTTPYGGGSAFADYGVLKVGASDARAWVPGGPQVSRTEATALWRDRVTITTAAPGSGIARFMLSVAESGVTTGEPWDPAHGYYRTFGGISAVDFVVAIDGAANLEIAYGRGSIFNPDGGSVSYRVGGVLHTDQLGPGTGLTGNWFVDVPFTSGTAFDLRVQAVCSAATQAAGADLAGSAFCDATHSLRWAGLAGVTFAGQPVAGRTTTSSVSGFGYGSFAPTGVPDPAAWQTMIAGLMLAGVVLRWRRTESLRADPRLR